MRRYSPLMAYRCTCSRGNNDQRVRPEIDWGIITDEDPAHASDVVMNAGRVDAPHLKAKSRADEALREGNEPYVQSAQESVQIARRYPQKRLITEWAGRTLFARWFIQSVLAPAAAGLASSATAIRRSYEIAAARSHAPAAPTNTE